MKTAGVLNVVPSPVVAELETGEVAVTVVHRPREPQVGIPESADTQGVQ